MLWYTGGAAVDRAIEQAFGPWVEKALAAQLPQWQQSPEGLIALVILLDQFTRNIYRGDARAFAGDPQARELVKQGSKLRATRNLQLL